MNMKSFIDVVAQRAPALGKIKRQVSGFGSMVMPPRTSYSQHGEDLICTKLLSAYRLNTGIYVDVGANHPTSISNTYLFYRSNYHGVTIDANDELVRLHRRYRRRDTSLHIGCGSEALLAEFFISKTPVLSRFSISRNSVDKEPAYRTEFVPILPLDKIIPAFKKEFIFLLSIDVEGLDYEVLLGAEQTLARVLCLCIETGDATNEEKITSYLVERRFRLETNMGCNLIFFNQNPWFNQFLREPKSIS